MKKLLTIATAFTLALSPAAFAADSDSSKEIHHTSVVESGTYPVTAKRVDAGEKEIYVTTADGKVLELYFKDDTKLTRGGKDVPFSALKDGQKLEVTVEKASKHLKPVSIVIVE